MSERWMRTWIRAALIGACLWIAAPVSAQITVGPCEILSGSGSPEGVLTARQCALYVRTDGGTSTSLYVKETGTGNTGWVAYGGAGVGGTPAGSDTQIQYNNGGAFGGAAGAIYDDVGSVTTFLANGGGSTVTPLIVKNTGGAGTDHVRQEWQVANNTSLFRLQTAFSGTNDANVSFQISQGGSVVEVGTITGSSGLWTVNDLQVGSMAFPTTATVDQIVHAIASNSIGGRAGFTFDGTTFSVPSAANGAALAAKSATTSVTCNSGTATCTATALIPAGATLISVTARVTTILAGAGLTTWSLGDGVTADLWAATKALAAGTTAKMTDHKSTWNVKFYAAANNVVLTADAGQFDSGVVRLTLFYFDSVAPTS